MSFWLFSVVNKCKVSQRFFFLQIPPLKSVQTFMFTIFVQTPKKKPKTPLHRTVSLGWVSVSIDLVYNETKVTVKLGTLMKTSAVKKKSSGLKNHTRAAELIIMKLKPIKNCFISSRSTLAQHSKWFFSPLMSFFLFYEIW